MGMSFLLSITPLILNSTYTTEWDLMKFSQNLCHMVHLIFNFWWERYRKTWTLSVTYAGVPISYLQFLLYHRMEFDETFTESIWKGSFYYFFVFFKYSSLVMFVSFLVAMNLGVFFVLRCCYCTSELLLNVKD